MCWSQVPLQLLLPIECWAQLLRLFHSSLRCHASAQLTVPGIFGWLLWDAYNTIMLKFTRKDIRILSEFLCWSQAHMPLKNKIEKNINFIDKKISIRIQKILKIFFKNSIKEIKIN
jgi:hypothetical protein